MCYDISFKVDIRQLDDYFPDLVFDEQISINFDAAVHIVGHAHGLHPIIYQPKEQEDLHCRLMEWGCIPYYVKDEVAFKKTRASMLNARSEKILDDTKSYWYKIRNRRCLIPVTAIFEHREIKGWKNKVPYHISLLNQPMFFIPGLYSVAELPDKTTGEMIKRFTYTMITRSANAVMKMIHNGGENRYRMPLFLSNELSKQWLSNSLTEEAYRQILNYELPAEALQYHPVYSIRTNKLRPDDKEKDAQYEWENLPGLEL